MHSFRAVRSLLMVVVFISMSGWPVLLLSLISDRAATALATTIGLESPRRSLRLSRKPCSSTRLALMSCSLATATAAVFLT